MENVKELDTISLLACMNETTECVRGFLELLFNAHNSDFLSLKDEDGSPAMGYIIEDACQKLSYVKLLMDELDERFGWDNNHKIVSVRMEGITGAA